MDEVDVLKLDGHGLRVFLTVFETGSMTEAALRLALNQSTVSHTVEKLRGLLNDPLFVRVGRMIVPTPYATALAPRVQALLADLQGLPASADFDPRRVAGTVSLAANVTELGPELLALFQRLRVEAPATSIRFLELGSRENIEAILSRGMVDLVLTVKATTYPATLQFETVLQDGFAVFYDPEARGPVTSLEAYCAADHGVLDFGGAKPSMIDLALRDRMVSRRVVVHAPNVYNLSTFITGTQIICTMQKRLGRSVLSHLAQCPVPVPMPFLKFDLVWHRRADADRRNMWLRSITRDSIASQVGEVDAK